MKRKGKSNSNTANRLFAILGLIVIASMVLALVISALATP